MLFINLFLHFMIKLFSIVCLVIPSRAIYDVRPDCEATDPPFVPEMQLLDRYILLICAPIAFICTVFNTSTFFIFPKTRRLPGDIIFAISICECVLSIHWFVSAYYDLTRQISPLSESNFC